MESHQLRLRVREIDSVGLTTRATGSGDLRMGRNGEELKRMAALRIIAEETGGEDEPLRTNVCADR